MARVLAEGCARAGLPWSPRSPWSRGITGCPPAMLQLWRCCPPRGRGAVTPCVAALEESCLCLAAQEAIITLGFHRMAPQLRGTGAAPGQVPLP